MYCKPSVPRPVLPTPSKVAAENSALSTTFGVGRAFKPAVHADAGGAKSLLV
jgi:hypothetical protein